VRVTSFALLRSGSVEVRRRSSAIWVSRRRNAQDVLDVLPSFSQGIAAVLATNLGHPGLSPIRRP
jgi:hypothetical protein